MKEPERRYWWHVHAEDEMPLLRHGRAHLTFPGRGTRNLYPGSSGQRRDLEFGSEWRFLILKDSRSGPFGFGWQIRWGTNGSDSTPDLSLHLSRLGDLWVHFGGLLPYRWLERHNADGSVDYDTRVFGFTADERGFRWDFWARDMHWSRSDPWWMRQSHEWATMFFGRDTVDQEIVAEGTCVVPMPEANYPATFETTKYTRRYKGRFGKIRDLVLGPRFHYSTNVEPGKPVAVPGKGENSWDCDDDAIYASSSGGRSVEHAIAGLVEHALQTRRRHGGEHMSIAPAS